MNLSDLCEQRSAEPPARIIHHLRMAGVREKVVARRRRRALVSGMVAVAMVGVLGVGGTTVASLDGPDTPAGTIEGFPEYYRGTRVVAAASGALDELLTFVFVPTTLDLKLYWSCEVPEPPWPVSVFAGSEDVFLREVVFRVNGEPIMNVVGESRCWHQLLDFGGIAPDEWAKRGVRVGEPAVVTAEIVDGELDTGPARRARWGLAVAEPVPFEEYVFPPRPQTLPPLREPAEACDRYYPVRLRADPADPNRSVETTIALHDYRVDVVSQTPGQLALLVDGSPAGLVEVWTYDGRRYSDAYLYPATLRDAGLDAADGDLVTLRIEPRYLTGEWLLFLTTDLDISCH